MFSLLSKSCFHVSKAVIHNLDDRTTCEICNYRMLSPYKYVLPTTCYVYFRPLTWPINCLHSLNCGHTFCEQCVTDWFDSILQKEGSRRECERIRSPEYSCPKCRVCIKSAPVRCFVVKDIAIAMDQWTQESVSTSVEVAEVLQHARKKRMWDKYFPEAHATQPAVNSPKIA